MTPNPSAPRPSGPRTPSRLSRRGLLVGGVALATVGVAAARWFNVGASIDDGSLGVAEAHRLALSGEILLVDIRRPDEWSLTGIGEGAQPLDMRARDFEARLLALAEGDKARPIALICARGVRSRGMARRLASAGFTRVLDVPEGMLGSGAGPGWIKAGLPLARL